MTIQPASLMLIKIGDGQDPENFSTVGGLQNVELDISHEHPVSNTVESGKWQSVNTSAGFSRVAIAGEGVYTDSAAEGQIITHALAHTAANYQFHFSNGDSISGAFVIANYNRLGNIESEETFLITLLNHGTVTFTAA